jgi:AcrR family transcriptional regulator
MRRITQAAQDNPDESQPPTSIPLAERPPRLSRRERRKIATREALVAAAQEVIAVKGVYLAVIEEITERADVAKGSFYQYFRDRDDLLHVILSRRLEELHAIVEAISPPRSLAERIRVLLRHHLEYFLRHEDFLLFLHQIRGLIKMKGDEAPAVRETYQRYMTFLAEWLQPQDAETKDADRLRQEGACAFLGFLTGFLSHYAVLAPLTNLTPDKAHIETALAAACVTFWRQ